MGSGVRKYFQIPRGSQCRCRSHCFWVECLVDIRFQTPELFTTDLRGLHHVLTHSDIYQKPDLVRRNLSKIMGRGKYIVFKTRMWLSLYYSELGVLFVEGDQHKNQRRIMVCLVNCLSVRSTEPDWPRQNPAFGPIQIRGLTDIFTEKANQVCHHHTFIIAYHLTLS